MDFVDGGMCTECSSLIFSVTKREKRCRLYPAQIVIEKVQDAPHTHLMIIVMRYGAVVCPRIPMVLLQHILHLMVHCGGGGGRAAGGRRWRAAVAFGGRDGRTRTDVS